MHKLFQNLDAHGDKIVFEDFVEIVRTSELLVEKALRGELAIPDFSDFSKNLDSMFEDVKKIKSSFGQTEIRPTVHMKIQIGAEIWLTEITLAQRAKLTYPMLIGRNSLNKKHIIHSHKSYLAGSSSTKI